MDNGDEKFARRLGGMRKSLRVYIDRINYYLSPGSKSAIYSQLERTMDLILQYIKEDEEMREEMDLSSLGKSYSELMGTISTAGPVVSDGAEKTDIKNSLKDFLKSTMQIELKARGFKAEEMGESEMLDEDAITADELADMMV